MRVEQYTKINNLLHTGNTLIIPFPKSTKTLKNPMTKSSRIRFIFLLKSLKKKI